ncbi:uncharacterized protein LOC124350011 [Daphnia pulicaria]|uniref:uncharacterized protein LOC124350011 n=1 Tax=Daphnia pulicaria TaxID=35523 RepID=UPI001EEC6DB7|nr:uncharacterized protein LOC124350011 [Daphnia pulicaria]
MAFSTSASIALFLVATICCSIVNAAKLRPALPSSVVDRQSKQIYVAPHQFYNYYQPYQYQMLLPTAAGETDSKSTPGDSELGALEGRQNLPLTATPAKTECLIADSAKNGFNGCTKASHSASGTIDLTFSEAKQGVVIALVPNPRYYSKLKITCSEMSDKVMAFTKTAKIAKATDTPVTESKETQLFVVSNAAGDKFKCSWESSE